jgi:hypothetical protein
MSLRSTRGQTQERLQSQKKNSKKQFDRTVRSSSRVKGQFKDRSSSSSEKAVRVGVQERSQPSRLVEAGRRFGPFGPREIHGTTGAVEETNPGGCNLSGF